MLAQGLGDEPRAEPVRREILAVFDSREEPRPDQTRIHRFAEMPLTPQRIVDALHKAGAYETLA